MIGSSSGPDRFTFIAQLYVDLLKKAFLSRSTRQYKDEFRRTIASFGSNQTLSIPTMYFPVLNKLIPLSLHLRNLKEHGLPTETVTFRHKRKTRPKLLHPDTPNLLSPHVMESGSLSLRGWWMSHVKWEVTKMRRRSKPTVRQASDFGPFFKNRVILGGKAREAHH